MENVLKYVYYFVGIVIGIGLIIAAMVLLYYLIKAVYLDIKCARDYDEYYSAFYKKLYDMNYEKLKDEYEFKLTSKSKEYFKQFYEEEITKKKEEQNGN